MILPAHDLRRHIARSATRIIAIVRLHCSGNAKICDPQIPFLIKYDIFRLDISMDNVIEMQKL